ncbi:MAG: GNAT family N-acetyltransferase [Candidatus Poseidoniaceae archaeon]|nr:GNAT family N-acetyltransferase [Candidatus Poseidoniaceae archaeon]
MQDAVWLREMLSHEMEVRPPRSLRVEQKILAGNVATLRIDGDLIGFTEIRNYVKTAEIATFIIDPKHRGEGNANKLVLKAIKMSPQKRIISCTKNPKMAKVLKDCGFEKTYWPGLLEYSLLTINTIKRIILMLLGLEFKRLWIQAKGFMKYKIYKLEVK